jgi:hypothetical protein
MLTLLRAAISRNQVLTDTDDPAGGQIAKERDENGSIG